jgi:hypothetical protein
MMRQANQPEEKLSAALRELAESSRQGASPELGSMLKNAFRRHHARRRRILRMRVAVLCVCVAGLTAAFLLSRPFLKKGPQIAMHTIPPQEVHQPQDISASATARPAPPRTVSPKRAAANTNNAFVALPSIDMIPAGDELRVVRLEMPGEDLRLVGAPVTEEIARRRVTADFVIGHDGTPYAVRLVQARF